MKKTLLFVMSIALLGLLSAGCVKKEAQFGDKAEDWEKTEPPASWRGPGQPGGPPPGAVGPGVMPPTGG